MSKILDIDNIHMAFSNTFTGINGVAEKEHASILKGIHLSFTKGKATALLGTNGSGKSTLFNIISGLLQPTQGAVQYYSDGQIFNLCKLPPYQHARIGIARLFQGSNIFPELSVLDNMKVADNNHWGEQPWQIFHRNKASEAYRTQEAEQILKELLGIDNPLWKKRNEAAGDLSIGQQRLLAFARLFMNEKATLYLLDEPGAGVNPQIRTVMANMIQRLKSLGKTVVLIEHNLDFVAATCDEACYIEDGKVKYHGSIAETLSHPDLKMNYLGDKV